MCIWQPHVKLNVAHKSSPVSLNITVLLPKDLIPSIKVIIIFYYCIKISLPTSIWNRQHTCVTIYSIAMIWIEIHEQCLNIISLLKNGFKTAKQLLISVVKDHTRMRVHVGCHKWKMNRFFLLHHWDTYSKFSRSCSSHHRCVIFTQLLKITVMRQKQKDTHYNQYVSSQENIGKGRKPSETELFDQVVKGLFTFAHTFICTRFVKCSQYGFVNNIFALAMRLFP